MRTILFASLLLVVVGCADDTPAEPTTVELPPDPDAVVVRWSVPVGNGVAPGGTSRLVITSGGVLYEAVGVGPHGWQGPPLPALRDYVVRPLEPGGLQRVMARAGELGLLETAPEYADVGITDQASTELVLATADGQFTHLAYALAEPEDETDIDRRSLARFVMELADLDAITGGQLGAATPFQPTTYSVWVEPVDDVLNAVQWTSSVELDTLHECIAVPAVDVERIAEGASVFTVVDAGAQYHLRVAPVLPVDQPCQP